MKSQLQFLITPHPLVPNFQKPPFSSVFPIRLKARLTQVNICLSLMMHCLGRRFVLMSRSVHTSSRDAPSLMLRKKIADIEKIRKKKNPKKDALFVEVPEGTAWLDTATMPMILTAVGIALFAKLLMMYDDSRSQEMIERKIQNAPPGQGTVRMLTREEWEDVVEIRPRTPFESKLARPNARIRTDEPVRKEDLKDWTIDVLTDAFTRAEETVKQNRNN